MSQPNEVHEGEIIEGLPKIPYEFDSERRLALIGLDADQLVLVTRGLQMVAQALSHEGYEAEAQNVALHSIEFGNITTELKTL